MNTKRLITAFSVSLIAGVGLAVAQTRPATSRPARPAPPARDPNTPGYVKAKELPDGKNPPADADGNFIIGLTHKPAPELAKREDVPKGKVFDLTMKSQDSKFYPGIARDALGKA